MAIDYEREIQARESTISSLEEVLEKVQEEIDFHKDQLETVRHAQIDALTKALAGKEQADGEGHVASNIWQRVELQD